jgi:DNA mismatch endonuclease (patch repair protein)
LKPAKREETLNSIACTLNHIWLQDHGAKTIPYPKQDEEDMQMPMAAEYSNF